MAATAVAAVFGIVELIEEILSYLTTKELTRVQRVSPIWQECILASPDLSRTLFFDLHHGEVVPFVRRIKVKNCKSDFRLVFHDPSGCSSKSCLPILRFAPPVQVRAVKRDRDAPRQIRTNSPPLTDIRDLLARKPGAWEQMRLTQPSLMHIEVVCSVVAAIGLSGEDFWDDMHHRKIEIDNPNGICIADLTEKIRSLMRDYELETGEDICMTSYFDATLKLPKFTWEWSKEVQKAFRQHELVHPKHALSQVEVSKALDEVEGEPNN